PPCALSGPGRSRHLRPRLTLNPLCTRLRPPPVPPPLPYTTLFRSGRARPLLLRGERAGRRARHPRVLGLELRTEAAGRGLERDADRKSTRLNSSHVSISYAVVCLQKQNIERT